MSLLSPARRSKHRHEDAELNLIPLIDIMSVLVAFLLVYTNEVEIVQNSRGVEIPQSTVQTKPTQTVVVSLTKERLFVQGELVASIGDIETSGADQIEALRAVLMRPMGEDGSAPPDATDLSRREITVLADKDLPYGIVKKVMATCTAAAYGKLSLAVMEKSEPAALASL
jgi:biopolymer transport protein TolR